MFHAEQLCHNPLTGRTVWLLRHIPNGKFGEPWDVSVVLVRARYGDTTGLLVGGEKIDSVGLAKQLRSCITELGFNTVTAIRHGEQKKYKVNMTYTQLSHPS